MGIEALVAPIIGAVAGKVLNRGSESSQQASSPVQAQNAAQAGNQQSWTDINRANDLNKQNMGWALQQNRPNQSSSFGSSNWSQDPTTGQWTQSQQLDPTTAAMSSALRGQQETAINAVNPNFDVNGDVMNAYRAQAQPLMDQQRNQENARLAAMGLGSGSGSAWGNSQDVLNRAQNDVDSKSVLAGFNANQQLQQSNRANLGVLDATETGWRNNAQFNSPAMVNLPQIQTPTNQTTQAQLLDNANAMGQNGAYANAAQTLAGVAIPGIIDWWNGAGSANGTGLLNQNSGMGYGGGGNYGMGSYNPQGFQIDPWSGQPIQQGGWNVDPYSSLNFSGMNDG